MRNVSNKLGFISVKSLIWIFCIFASHYIFAQNMMEQIPGIFIQGNSLVIIETVDNESNIFANTIETLFGGSFQKIILNNQIDPIVKNKYMAYASEFAQPNSFIVQNAYPNPFNPSTKVRYGLPESSNVKISIFDLQGRLISEYNLGEKQPGWHEFLWDGYDKNDQHVSSGIYFLSLKSGEHYHKQKLTFLE